MWTVWVAAHRGVLYGIITLATWVAATYWFFKHDIKRLMQARKPHNWTVNMETKTGKGGSSKSLH